MKSYVGYSTDEYIRYHATSGGVGTALIKYMFEKGIINTSISFDFDASTLRYNPKIIHIRIITAWVLFIKKSI